MLVYTNSGNAILALASNGPIYNRGGHELTMVRVVSQRGPGNGKANAVDYENAEADQRNLYEANKANELNQWNLQSAAAVAEHKQQGGVEKLGQCSLEKSKIASMVEKTTEVRRMKEELQRYTLIQLRKAKPPAASRGKDYLVYYILKERYCS
ncbi:hypothetical protein ABKV19_022940 [Rosa sericea]